MRAIYCLFITLFFVGAAVGETTPPSAELIENPLIINELLKKGEIREDQIPSPHWKEESCAACHEGGEAGAPALIENDINKLCNNCHGIADIEAYIHPVGMTPPDEFIARMPETFRAAIERGGDRVTCIACHDLPMQCNPARRGEQALNPRFFRGGPYGGRTDLCFNCHNPEQYERYNPHDQISDEGELQTERCYVCHSVIPDRQAAKSIDDVQFNLAENLERLCTGCHPWRPHPGGGWASFARASTPGNGPNHLTVPPEPIRRNLERHQREKNIIMPLEPLTGRVFCGTCHNPHERGVQLRYEADKGADGVKRLRRGHYEICTACHNK